MSEGTWREERRVYGGKACERRGRGVVAALLATTASLAATSAFLEDHDLLAGVSPLRVAEGLLAG